MCYDGVKMCVFRRKTGYLESG